MAERGKDDALSAAHSTTPIPLDAAWSAPGGPLGAAASALQASCTDHLTNQQRAARLGGIMALVGACAAQKIDGDTKFRCCAALAAIVDGTTDHIRMLREAGVREGNYRLPGTTLYVTLEPCTMCCGALVHARVETLIFAAREPRAGAVVSTGALLDNPAFNHRVRWTEGLCEAESADLLRQFFQRRRSAPGEAD